MDTAVIMPSRAWVKARRGELQPAYDVGEHPPFGLFVLVLGDEFDEHFPEGRAPYLTGIVLEVVGSLDVRVARRAHRQHDVAGLHLCGR